MVPYHPQGLSIAEMKLYAASRRPLRERLRAALAHLGRVRSLDDLRGLAEAAVRLGSRWLSGGRPRDPAPGPRSPGAASGR
jgi:hypothetical protein